MVLLEGVLRPGVALVLVLMFILLVSPYRRALFVTASLLDSVVDIVPPVPVSLGLREQPARITATPKIMMVFFIYTFLLCLLRPGRPGARHSCHSLQAVELVSINIIPLVLLSMGRRADFLH